MEALPTETITITMIDKAIIKMTEETMYEDITMMIVTTIDTMGVIIDIRNILLPMPAATVEISIMTRGSTHHSISIHMSTDEG